MAVTGTEPSSRIGAAAMRYSPRCASGWGAVSWAVVAALMRVSKVFRPQMHADARGCSERFRGSWALRWMSGREMPSGLIACGLMMLVLSVVGMAARSLCGAGAGFAQCMGL